MADSYGFAFHLQVEAPLTPLFDSGFLTPSSLFYVRSHGATPLVDGDLLANWRVEVSG